MSGPGVLRSPTAPPEQREGEIPKPALLEDYYGLLS